MADMICHKVYELLMSILKIDRILSPQLSGVIVITCTSTDRPSPSHLCFLPFGIKMKSTINILVFQIPVVEFQPIPVSIPARGPIVMVRSTKLCIISRS
jgi:hypothetical protein